MRRVLFAALLACGAAACDRDRTPAALVRSEVPIELARDALPTPRTVVLVTLDGVRWQDVFERSFARMPKTRAQVEARGAALGGCGVVRADNPAFLSLPGYLELLTGRRTTCAANTCARVSAPTILDDAAADSAARGLGPVASIDAWPTLSRAASSGRSSVLVSAGRTPWPGRPVDDAALEAALAASEAESESIAGDLYRPDEHTARIALAYLKSARPRLLHVGLGDTDEHAHEGDRAAYLRAIETADAFVDEVAATLEDEAAVVITADHGRSASFRDHGSAFPESARSFVLAFGDGVAARGVMCDHRTVTLPDVGATVRALAGLPPDRDPGAGRPIDAILM